LALLASWPGVWLRGNGAWSVDASESSVLSMGGEAVVTIF
jgi:hypothetical protein